MIDDAARKFGDEGRKHHEKPYKERDLAHDCARNFALYCELVQKSQRNHAEDVVQYCGPDHNLRLVGLALPDVFQHPHRDTDTGGGQRAADEECDKIIQPKPPAANRISEYKRQHETHHRHHQRLESGFGQSEQIRIHAHFEEQQNNADFRQQFHRGIGGDPAQQGRTQ